MNTWYKSVTLVKYITFNDSEPNSAIINFLPDILCVSSGDTTRTVLRSVRPVAVSGSHLIQRYCSLA